jgi:hypothetical protein
MNIIYKPGLIAFICNDITDFNGMNNNEYYPITKESDLICKRFKDVIKDVFYIGDDSLYNITKQYCIEKNSYYKSEFTLEEQIEIIEKQMQDLKKIKKELKQKLK